MYPASQPFDEGSLKVDDIHTLHYFQCGKRDGKPIIFLHGGPGGSASPAEVSIFFNPEVYRIIAFHQRGAGKSEPTANLENNTTWDSVSDTEKLREHLGVDKWVVFGGSWGSTLSLAYAQSHPDRVKALILRGIFLLRRSELEFFYSDGTSHIWPEEWDVYASIIPPEERGDIIAAYYKRLTDPDDAISLKAAQAWTKAGWEQQTSRLKQDPESVAKADNDLRFSRAFARIECHYFVNRGFMPDGFLIQKQQIDKIRHLPCVVVQGRYDVVCPARSAWDLKKAWDSVELQIVDDAGHSAKEPGIADLLSKAADKFENL